MSAYHLILINGWAGTPAVWQPLLTQLEQTPSAPAVTRLDWTAALPDPAGAVRAHLHPDRRNVLLGWSLGGMLALEAACASGGPAPAALLLVASTARMCAEGNYPGADPRAIKAMKLRLRKDRPGLLRDFAALCFPDSDSASEARDDYAQAAAALPPEALAAGLEYLLTRDLRPQLNALRCPLFLLHAEDDAVIPAASARTLAGLVPAATYQPRENGGHALPMTRPDAIICALDRLPVQPER